MTGNNVDVPRQLVGAIEMFYEVRGRGEPLVLVGGLGLAVADLHPLIEELAAFSTVIAVDNRGSGQSSKPAGPYSIDQMAGDLAGLLDAIGVDHAHVLGISMGGRIALSFALSRPQRVDRLVLVSTGARVGGTRRRVRLGMALARVPVLRGRNASPHHALEAQFDASTNFDCTDRLGSIRNRTLVVHGSRDHVAPLELAEQMATAIPASTFVHLDGGHLVSLLPKPRRKLVAAVRQFLAST